MNYRFHCPHCGHGQESPFVRIGAQVACPRCEEVFRIEVETLEGGSGGGLGAAAGQRPAAGSGGEDAENPLGGQEPEALVGLSGLSGLMHEAEDAEGEETDAEAGPFPGGGGSFKGAAESGAGVDASDALGMDDTPPTPPRAPAEAQPGSPVPPPPTRDMLRRQRQRDREEAEADAAKRRRVVMLAAAGLGLAIAFALILVVLLGGEAGTPAASLPPAPPAPAATAPEAEEDASPLAEEPPRVVYARGVEPGTGPGAPERRPGVEGAAEATPDPLGQTRRLEVTLTATGDAVKGPLRLHFEADAPGSPAWAADVPAGLAAGQTRRITVALVPPLPTTVEGWSVTPFR